jgi:hypothetical protein
MRRNVTKNNNQFSTQDINLAAYLHANGVILLSIEPLDSFHSSFIFEQPPQELLDYWLSGATIEKQVINSYRHLVKDSRNAQREMGGR